MANDKMTHDEIIQRMLKLDIDVMILRVVLLQVIRSIGNFFSFLSFNFTAIPRKDIGV